MAVAYGMLTGEPGSQPAWWALIRSGFVAGSVIAGPAIVAEDETSTFVPSGFGAALDSVGYIVMERTAESAS